MREATGGLKFPYNITDSAACITTYSANIFERLNVVRYGGLKFKNPKHAIKLIPDCLKFSTLKFAMEDRVKVESGIGKTFECSFNVSEVMLHPGKLLNSNEGVPIDRQPITR